MNKKQSQSGFAHLAIIITLAVALVGILGFVYWQNFMQPKTNGENVVVTKTTDDTTTTITTAQTAPAVDPSTVVNDFVASFLNYMNSSATDHTDAAFATQSSALTDNFRNSIISPDQGLLYSPIILAQNIPTSFIIGSATEASNVQSVPVTLKFGNSNLTIIYSLVLVDNEWKINGVSEA